MLTPLSMSDKEDQYENHQHFIMGVYQQAIMMVELYDELLQEQPRAACWTEVHEAVCLGRLEKHSGVALVPPLGGPERREALGQLVSDDVDVTGTSWKFSTVDVAIAGAAFVTSCAHKHMLRMT